MTRSSNPARTTSAADDSLERVSLPTAIANGESGEGNVPRSEMSKREGASLPKSAAAPLAARQAPTVRDELSGHAPGQRVGRYTLVARLASGGMAHVWTAEPDSGSGMSRTVAIKIIRSELAGDRDYARMFIDEAAIATSIEHPNVCQTFELSQHEGTMYMAMEWVPGDSLGGMLRDVDHFAPLKPALAARICADSCAGLYAAHIAVDEQGNSLGVVHRDVSPPNILISLQGQVKVSDFGIAKARHQLHERTKTGEVKGKFGYLAPEQITGGKTDHRIDIYALGCVLYVATTGLRPFGNGPKAMGKILLGEFRKPSRIDPTFPPGLEQIIIKALSHDPEERYQTAGEMRNALERWLIDSRQLVTAADVAAELVGRMQPETLAGIKRLQARRRGKLLTFDALLEDFDQLEPPTASSGMVTPPTDLLEQARKTPPLQPEELLDVDEDPTIRTAARAEETLPEPEDGSDARPANWHAASSSHEHGREHPTFDVERANATLPPNRPRRSRAQTTSAGRLTKKRRPRADLRLLGLAGIAGAALAIALWFLLS